MAGKQAFITVFKAVVSSVPLKDMKVMLMEKLVSFRCVPPCE